MSRTTRKIQKRISETKSAQPKGEENSSTTSKGGNADQLLRKLLNAEVKRIHLTAELNNEISAILKELGDYDKEAETAKKTLEQQLQQTRRELQEAWDNLSDTQEKLQQMEVEKLKAEQKLQWAKVELQVTKDELQVTKDELKRVEEKVALEAELDHWEYEISRYKRRIGRTPNSHEVYESQLKAAEEARDRCFERLKQLQEARGSENFKGDSPFRLLSEESNAALWEYVNGRDSTDEVVFRTEEDEARLLETWGTDDVSFIEASTVPLEDFVITLVNSSARVLFDSDDSVGVMIIETKLAGLPKRIELAFFMRPINGALTLSANLGYDNLLAAEKKFIESQLNMGFGKDFLALGYKVLPLWHAVERALLNPPIREYIAGRNLEKIDGQGAERDENVVTYVKRIPITVDDLLIGNEPKVVNWHVDKWGVAGHWRKYSNGKKVWVRPHEKGRKRGQKLDSQELRERIVVTE